MFYRGFLDFLRERGVAGLAVGFILGGAISKLVGAIVTDIVNPIVGLAVGSVGDLKEAHISIGDAKIMWGDLLSVTIDFIVIAAVVYIGFKVLGLEKIDKKPQQ